MATAEATTRTVLVTEGVTLKLSAAEARAVFELTRRVNGSTSYSPRKHTDAVQSALRDVLGARWPVGVEPESSLMEGSVYCENYA